MATCEEMRLLVGPFDDGELEPHEMEEVAFHVVGCLGCKAALDDYRGLGVALRGAVIEPVLAGFAAQVAERIAHSWIPLHVRVSRMRDLFGRVGSIFEIAVVAAATAMLTMVIASPYARNLALRGSAPVAPPLNVARADLPKPPDVAAQLEPVNRDATPVLDLAEDPMTESEQLMAALGGGDSPSVAVWNEPRTGTTVVWVPDQR